MKIFKFDMFEDPPKAQPSVFMKLFKNQSKINTMPLYDFSKTPILFFKNVAKYNKIENMKILNLAMFEDP